MLYIFYFNMSKRIRLDTPEGVLEESVNDENFYNTYDNDNDVTMIDRIDNSNNNNKMLYELIKSMRTNIIVKCGKDVDLQNILLTVCHVFQAINNHK